MNKRRKMLMTSGMVFIAACMMMMRGKVHALEPPARDSVENVVERFLQAQAASIPGRVETRVGTLDSRLAKPACERLDASLPSGSRLWGRTQIAVRCADAGSRFSVYVPVEVRVFGPAIVTTHPLANGHELAPEDLKSEEIELTREPPGVIADPASAVQKVTTRALAAGTVLRAEHLRPKSVIGLGDSVKVVYVGDGFSIASEGKSLMSASDGQTVRVQMESGRIINGTARTGRRVEVR